MDNDDVLLIVMVKELSDLPQLVAQEKIRFSKSSFPQTTLDNTDYNDKLSLYLANSIATSLEQNSFDSKLMEYSREPFVLGKIVELIRTIRIAPWKKSTADDFTFRKNVGMYYTPEPIVEYIVKCTLTRWFQRVNSLENESIGDATEAWMDLKLIDPACGTGSFLIIAARILLQEYQEFAKRNGKSVPLIEDYKERLFTHILHGVDVDAVAVRLCSASLRFHLGVDANLSSLIVCGDSLTAPLQSSPEFESIEGWPEPVHFSERFPDVFGSNLSGFDILIMNPPYGKLRAESGKGIRKNKEEDKAEKRRYERLRKHLKNSKMYPYSKGVLNWYKLFVERSLQLLNKDGSMGFIVPSTILCDDSTKELRKALLQHELSHLLEIPENNNFFESVTQSYSIGILNKQKLTDKTDFRFGVKSMEEVSRPQEGVVLSAITQVTERSFSIPLTTQRGLEIYLKMHQNPIISNIKNIINKRGEIDLTMFKPFLSNSEGEGKVRLLRGTDVRFCRLEPMNMEKPSLIDKQKALSKLGTSQKTQHLSKSRLVCQQIANQNNSDRLIFAMIEANTFCGNSLNYVCWKGEDESLWNEVLLGILNSTLLDWRFKITSTNNHVNNYEIDELPIPIKDISDPQLNDKLLSIGSIARELTICTLEQIKPLTNKLDKLVFSLYGLTEKEIKFVLEEMNVPQHSINEILDVIIDE